MSTMTITMKRERRRKRMTNMMTMQIMELMNTMMRKIQVKKMMKAARKKNLILIQMRTVTREKILTVTKNIAHQIKRASGSSKRKRMVVRRLKRMRMGKISIQNQLNRL